MNKVIAILFSIVVFAGDLYSQEHIQERKRHFNLEDGLAIQGYDPVSYFNEEEPLEGKKSLSYTYNGVTYYFSSEENRELFKANPEKFEPEYGGWCAYALGDSGEKVKIDPETYKIVNGKLYLFYNFFFNNTLTDWNKDEKRLKANADTNWKKIIDE